MKLHGSQAISWIIPTNDFVVSVFWKFAILPINIVIISEIRLRINGMINIIAHKRRISISTYANAIAIPLYEIFFWKKSIIASIASEITYAMKIR